MKALWGLALGNFAVGTGALVIAGVLPDIAHDTGVSDAQSGQLITIYAITYALAAPILGSLTGKMDRRLLLTLAALLIAASNIVGATTTDFTWLMAARLTAAIGAALFSPVAVGVATTLVPPGKVAGAIALVFGGFVVSSVLGVPLGVWIGGEVGWQGSYGFVAIIAIVAALAVILTVPGGLKAQGSSFRALGQVLAHRRLMVAISMGASQMAAQFVPYTFIALLLLNKASIEPGEMALAFMMFGGFSVLANVIGGRASDKYGPQVTMMVTMAALPMVLAGLEFLDYGLAVATMLMAIWGMAGFGFAAAQQARLVQLAPELRGVVLSLHASSLYVGQAIGAPLGAWILTDYGLDWLGWGGAAVAVLSFATFIVSLRQWGDWGRKPSA
jgi:DHA1 family inner membrane transport protein